MLDSFAAANRHWPGPEHLPSEPACAGKKASSPDRSAGLGLPFYLFAFPAALSTLLLAFLHFHSSPPLSLVSHKNWSPNRLGSCFPSGTLWLNSAMLQTWIKVRDLALATSPPYQTRLRHRLRASAAPKRGGSPCASFRWRRCCLRSIWPGTEGSEGATFCRPPSESCQPLPFSFFGEGSTLLK